MSILQFISHKNERFSYTDGIRLALEGGCRWIQLRIKEASPHEIRPLALEVQELCRTYCATFILDDQVELARDIHADGVHLGKKDMPVSEARKILGTDYIIGGTANTFEDIQVLAEAGANYIGCGPFRFTTTKKELSPILGLEGYRYIIRRMKEEGIALPIVAIGGIMPDDIPAVMQTGITGIALSGAILNADNPTEETKKIIKILSHG